MIGIGSSAMRTAAALRYSSLLDLARWRLRILCCVLIVLALFVFPGVAGAIATAQHATAATSTSEIDALSWMNVRDSSGIPLANYMFATDRGGALDPGATVLWSLLGLEFIGYIAMVTTAIWFIGYALSFRWLDMFGAALRGVATALTEQISTPIVLLTAATIGAFCVAWFVVRGFHAKATMQVVTMVGVAILGPVFLADPLAEVLSSHGLLAHGRDLGISVAAGLHGHGNPNPHQLVATIQGDMADNFARRPLQVWNFGHVVDERPSCRSAWSAGVSAGDDSRVRNGMQTCGDTAAHAKAENPTMGQVCTGLLLLICGSILLVFAAYLGIKVIKAALDSVYHGFMSIFGFAAGGFVYGPTQTFLVRNIVDGFVAAARMTAYTVFLGVYLLFLGSLFRQANGQVVAVIIIAGTVETVAISQLRRLSSGLSRGNDWIANRFAAALQGIPARSASSGGTALGMGRHGTDNSPSKSGLVTGLATINTFNSSPISAWLAAGTINPLNPLARGRKKVERNNIRTADARRERYLWDQLARESWRQAALTRVRNGESIHTELGVARALKGLRDSRVPNSQLPSVLLSIGANHTFVRNAMRALSTQDSTMSKNPYSFVPLQKAVAAGFAVQNHVGDEAYRAYAAQALDAAESLLRHAGKPSPGATLDSAFINRVEEHWHSDRALRAAITPREWNAAGRNTRWAIGKQAATLHVDAARAYYQNPDDPALRDALARSTRRLANLDHLDPGSGLDSWPP